MKYRKSLGQQNSYRGSPARPWLRLRFIGENGTAKELDLVADTGCPHAVVVSTGAGKPPMRSVISDFSKAVGCTLIPWSLD